MPQLSSFDERALLCIECCDHGDHIKPPNIAHPRMGTSFISTMRFEVVVEVTGHSSSTLVHIMMQNTLTTLDFLRRVYNGGCLGIILRLSYLND